MIGWVHVYKVAAAMAPLYFALGLGYGSVWWWKLFTPDQCGAINRLVIYFAFPFFGFDLTARAAGSFAASYNKKGGVGGGCSSYSWCITGFSLAALNNALLMGIPLLDAMHGGWAHDIAVQMSMMQIVAWFPLMLEMPPLPAATAAAGLDSEDGEEDSGDGKMVMTGWRSFWTPLLRTAVLKLAYNPNAYSSLLGVAWSSIANRYCGILELPSIVEGSVTIISKTGIGLGMFSMGNDRTSLLHAANNKHSMQVITERASSASMTRAYEVVHAGLFIALQDKFIMCGAGLTALSLVLRFVAGPAAAAAAILGLRGDLLRFAIVQDYSRDAGIAACVLIAYYLVLGLIR
ncbi:hypothetical protein HU200_000843 [Digitaria exilis]|uniref:Auxin efflux carrier component n=1 Tax=Digitaria exilis TaxID=1010633 RepID=A0A835G145_9POAL|nr:hypothetical protein HU200_000843 [Digitaria exilis]